MTKHQSNSKTVKPDYYCIACYDKLKLGNYWEQSQSLPKGMYECKSCGGATLLAGR